LVKSDHVRVGKARGIVRHGGQNEEGASLEEQEGASLKEQKGASLKEQEGGKRDGKRRTEAPVPGEKNVGAASRFSIYPFTASDNERSQQLRTIKRAQHGRPAVLRKA
jgi:hypothetical protein